MPEPVPIPPKSLRIDRSGDWRGLAQVAVCQADDKQIKKPKLDR